MLRVRVSTASAEIIETELITTGRRGLECAFEFNSAWDGLAKTVIVNGVVKRDIVLVTDTITVPGECLAREQFPLRIGVYGANGAGEIVIPTIWANFGKILPSAQPSGVDPDEVTPDVVAQIQTNSSDALRLAQEVMRRADSGEFDGRDGATGPSGPPGIDGRHGRNGNSIWTTTETPMPATGGVAFTQLTGRSGIPPVVGDIIVRSSRYVYQVVEVTAGGTVVASLMGDIKGEQGVADTIWRTTASIGSVYPFGYVVNVSDLVGRSGATPKAGDIVLGPESGQTGDPTYLYAISGVGSSVAGLDGVGSIKGAPGATGPQGPGVTEDLRAALLQLARKVAYIDEHGADYYQDLYDALYPSANLLSITVTFTQGSTVVYDDADLDDLRPMLYVVGHYDDNTDAEVTNYDLSGNLTAGSSVVTVSYQSKTTTFTVDVTARPTLSSISAVYTQSGAVYTDDTIDSLKADLVVTAHYSDSSTQTVPAADYTLSGTLTAGTSTITVAYGGKTTTFSVTVTTALLYSMYDRTFTAADDDQNIDTGVSLFTQDMNWSIACDVTENSAMGKTGWRFLTDMRTASPYDGFMYGSASLNNANTRLKWISTNNDNSTGFSNTFVGRHRIIITHAIGGGLTYYYKNNSDAVQTKSIATAWTGVESTSGLHICGTKSEANNGWNFVGHVNKIEVYGRVLTQSEINDFMSGE